MEDLEDIFERARSRMRKDDHDKLKASVETLGYLTHELEAKRVAVGRLKKLLFGSKSEKTDEVFGDSGEEETPEGSAGDVRDADTSSEEKKKRKGHGRNGAQEYEGAERIEVPHPSLNPGDPCPRSNCRGRVYRQKKPGLVLRIRGQAPVKAEVYEFEKLRCNLCGTVFTAEAPEGVGDEKYEATSASMFALLKYGSGLPFNRAERLEGNLRIPLPAATQWDIVNGARAMIGPAYEELIRQAAQGDIFHNDDTKARILALMEKRREKALAAMGLPRDSEESTGIFTSGIVSLASG